MLLCVLVGMWLSTLTIYKGSEDVRALVWLLCVVAPGVAALSTEGRRRVYWVGFFATVLAWVLRGVVPTIGINLSWTYNLARKVVELFDVVPSNQLQVTMVVNATLILIIVLMTAAIVGRICVHVHDECTRPTGE